MGGVNRLKPPLLRGPPTSFIAQRPVAWPFTTRGQAARRLVEASPINQLTAPEASPIDLDMPWAVSLKKSFSFIGKRSLARSDTARSDRKQLVGLLTDDPETVLREGAQIIGERGHQAACADAWACDVELL